MQQVITLPTWYIPTKWKNKWKRIWLSMNRYRNAHFQEKNKIKKRVKNMVSDMDITLPQWVLYIHYTYYSLSKWRADVSNRCSVCSKFFLDALAELWHIQDDNTSYVPEEYYTYWGISKNDWKIEIRFVKKPTFKFL